MVKLYGSYNSRFFVVRKPGQIDLHRGNVKIWSVPVKDRVVGELIRLSNSGVMFFRSSQGVFKLQKEVKKLQPIPTLTRLCRGDEGTYLGGLHISPDGKSYCYERIASVSRLSDKLLHFLKMNQEEPKVLEHQLLLYNTESQSSANYYTAFIDPNKKDKFYWSVSPSFKYLLVSQPERRGNILFQVIDIVEEALLSEFEMRVRDITATYINDHGTVGLEIHRPGEDKLAIAKLDGSRYLVNIIARSRIIHLGSNTVSMQTMPKPSLIVKHFDDSVVVNADLRPLVELGINFRIHFNDREDIDIIGYEKGILNITHTDLQGLPTDAKRWKWMAQQKQLKEEEKIIEEVTAQQKAQRQYLESLAQSRKLEESIKQPSAMTPEVLPLPTPRPGHESTPSPSLGAHSQTEPPKPISRTSHVTPLKSLSPPSKPPTPPPPRSNFPDTDEIVLPLPSSETSTSDDQLEHQLELLRMKYIAGEIDRNEYYKRCEEIEQARRKSKKVVQSSLEGPLPPPPLLDRGRSKPPPPNKPKRFKIEIDPS